MEHAPLAEIGLPRGEHTQTQARSSGFVMRMRTMHSPPHSVMRVTKLRVFDIIASIIAN